MRFKRREEEAREGRLIEPRAWMVEGGGWGRKEGAMLGGVA